MEERRENGRGEAAAAGVKKRTVSGVEDVLESGTEAGESGGKAGEETLMMELSRLVQAEVKGSSWWELRGKDCTILGLAFTALPPGKTHLYLPGIHLAWIVFTL